jgi:hypothetical protein
MTGGSDPLRYLRAATGLLRREWLREFVWAQALEDKVGKATLVRGSVLF